MALCSIAVAAGIVGAVALVKRLFWRRRMMMMMYGGGPFGMPAMAACGPAFGGPCGPGVAYGGPPWARWHGYGEGPACGPHGRRARGWRDHATGEGRIGGAFWLRGLFRTLDTTPGQEKEIRAAVEELLNEAKEAKSDLHASREAAARAVAGEVFDEIAIGDATVKLDAGVGRAKHAFEAMLRRVHAVLDDKQRARLAELLEQGPRGFSPFGGHPYRDRHDREA